MTEQAHTASHVWKYITNGILAALVIGFIIWAFIRTVKKSDDPGGLIFKWILTLLLFAFWLKVAAPSIASGSLAAFHGLSVTLVEAVIMAIIWRRNIASIIADPIGGLYDGGNTPAELKPLYSYAIAARKRGNYQAALDAVRVELEKFPGDFEGQMLFADIQAENLNDLPGAAVTIERICNQPQQTHGNIAAALNVLADWYLKFHQDRDAAHQTLQRIIDLYPDSELSALAAQRIAHLASTEHLLASHDRKKFAVVEGIQNLGLLDPKFHPQPKDVDAAKQAAELVQHLQSHPLDTDARERLAVIYADHYNRMDFASDQLEQLITTPNQPSKRVVHWLNLLADLQIRHGANYDTIRATLQRIIDLYPNTAPAGVAATRIDHLRLELKAQEKSQAVKLGSYEQDIGLKMK